MSKKPFQKVCVIGAGVMGSGIASHFANAGVSCLLLDIVPKGATNRNEFAQNGVKNALKIKPAAFMAPENARLIEVGNLEDDLEKVKTCDWVIEVVLEKMDVKQALFARLEAVVSPNTVVSSNTSGLSIHEMLAERGEAFRKNFLVTHFFNPPRYMHLLEIVAGPDTDSQVLERVADFSEHRLGKGIVYGKDTTNFVANRIGVFGMMESMRLMQAGNYTVEEVDMILGDAMGRPKSALFGTADVVGLDTFIHVAQNCYDHLQKDECHDVFASPAFMKDMVARGWLGRKSKQGFFKKVGSEIQVLDIPTMTYRPKQKVRFESIGAVRNMERVEDKVRSLVYAEDKAAKFAWDVTASTSIYSANRLFEIADDIVQIDRALKWGFNFKLGPFETWDAIGVKESCDRMQKEGLSVPAWVLDMLKAGETSFYKTDAKGVQSYWDPKTKSRKPIAAPKQTVSFDILRAQSTNIVKDGFAATLFDLGDGILGCEFHTKMNAIDADLIRMIHDGLDLCEDGKFNALVLANDGPNFSVGANLLMLYMSAQAGQFKEIEDLVAAFQKTSQRLYYSPIPTVAAPFQLTLGGGAELSMWCNRIQAHAELYMGLVELGVGLIPGGGGNIAMLANNLAGAVDDPNFLSEPFVRRAFECVAMSKVSTSAQEARNMFYMRASDGITMNRRHLLHAAKSAALGMVESGFIPPARRTYRLLGKSGAATIEMMVRSMRDGHFISEHDAHIAMKVAHVMTGGNCSSRQPVSEQYLLDLEREAFLSLCGEEKTQARVAYMLEHSKPLRN
jgi:3-hydroxyacyl-CoA dehydrogenase